MFTKMVDMRQTPQEKAEAMAPPTPSGQPDYSYRHCISFNEDDLEKLDLDDSDVEVGDMVDLRAMGRVTSVSKNEIDGKASCRIEVQLTHLAVEDEDKEK